MMQDASDRYLPQTAIALLDKGKMSNFDWHPGLELDKLVWAGEQKKQVQIICEICKRAGDAKLLKDLHDRRAGVLDALGANRFNGRTAGPLTLYLSRANALENAGMAFHPIYGFAWLPGTGLKGMTRDWAETVWKPGAADEHMAEEAINDAFGTTDVAGRIIFHDAWPVQWPQLEPDIVNVHHRKYYTGEQPPADREEPLPSYFFTVAADTEFTFALSDRYPAGDGLLEQVVGWMRAAMQHKGVGAKKVAGYGRIVPCGTGLSDPPALPDSHLRREHRLTLASPAFLAGGRQKEADCDLRPATLRGLLRWWWRTIHADHLDVKNLLALEFLIWGDTRHGSPVSLALRAGDGNKKPDQYDKNRVKQNVSLPNPHDRRTIQGLFYISYGMDEPGVNRWYRQPGDSWDLTITVCDTIWSPDRTGGKQIPAGLVLRQVEAALWLLARFGGLGAKCRKGFGSFDDITVEGIQNLEDCIRAGRDLREQCNLTMQIGTGTGTPALERQPGPIEIKTPWNNPWFALDRVGAVYQRFLKGLPTKDDKELLGLPRGKNKNRLASPVYWSLTRGSDKKLTVRLIAFPSTRDKGVLEKLATQVKQELQKEIEQHRQGGKAQIRPVGDDKATRQLQSGQRVQAKLLEEKTKKGGWKAQVLGTSISGNIQNNPDVPPDSKPGDTVELVVRIANPANAAFEWPKPEAAKPPPGAGAKNRTAKQKKRNKRR